MNLNKWPLLNAWQEVFLEWNAARLGTSLEDSKQRYEKSWNAFPGGHGSQAYRDFVMTAMENFRVLLDDRPSEVMESYRYHGWLILLRFLAYPIRTWDDAHPMISSYGRKEDVVIVDFGCGLAQHSISLLWALQKNGGSGELFLADIDTVRLQFLRYLTDKFNLKATMAICTMETPIPELPRCNIMIATEIFEHLHDPMPYLEKMNEALASGGFLLTNVHNHQREFQHVSPVLLPLHEKLLEWGYVELERKILFRKP